MEYTLLWAVLAAVVLLLFLILAFRLQAFIALLISSIAVGLFSGMPLPEIIDNISKGMGGTLGYVATVVGMGAIFGAILEYSGSTERISTFLLSKFGTRNAPAALSLSGFLIAIPVFFDVAFVILVPLLYGLQKKTGKSLLYFALPLLAGLATTHAFIPPTPGPIAVAEIIDVPLGWIILMGLLVGIPTTIISGILFGKYIAGKIHVGVPPDMSDDREMPVLKKEVPVGLIFTVILIPIVLILLNTVTDVLLKKGHLEPGLTPEIIKFLGHPFVALIISTLLALCFLGIRHGLDKAKLQEISTKALGPAGVIILITGAGGVFKQMLVESGAGVLFAEQMMAYDIYPLFLAFLLALIVRVLQGSATVAMITAAGILSPVLANMEMSEVQLSLIVLSIAAGASAFSHVNDSGFWLVNRYLDLTETQTLKSWTMMTGILSFSALILIFLVNQLIS